MPTLTKTIFPILSAVFFGLACTAGGTAFDAKTETVATTRSALTPVTKSECKFSKIGTLSGSTCAIIKGASGHVACWGSDDQGQLGDAGGYHNYPAKVLVSAGGAPFSGAIDIVGIGNVGYSDRTACALKSDGTVWCWGGNANGSLGAALSSNGATSKVSFPVQVKDSNGAFLTGITKLAGTFGLCGIKNDGTLWCWGGNAIADGLVTTGQAVAAQRNEARQIVVTAGGGPLTNVVDAALTRDMGCALKADKTAWCWGGDPNYTCVTGSQYVSAGQLNIPSAVSDYTQISAGYAHFCATRTGGGAHCWGADWGPDALLGDNTNAGTTVGAKCNASNVLDTSLAALSGVVKVSGGGRNDCALKSDGHVYCWGNNDYGALGNGTFSSSNVAVKVTLPGGADFSGVSDISAADAAACALKADGTAFCWGAGNQIGDNDPTVADKSNPTEVTCLECYSSADCSGSKPACDTNTNLCVECASNNDCKTAAKPACDTNTKTCIECTNNADCTNPANPLCDTNKQLCVPCFNDGDCTNDKDPRRRRCDYQGPTERSRCVQCNGNAGDVGATLTCNSNQICALSGPDINTCIFPCTGNYQSVGSYPCPETAPFCVTSGNKQGQCLPCDGDYSGATAAKCDALHPICLGSGKCGTCTATDTSRCIGATPYCDPVTNVCITEPYDGGPGTGEEDSGVDGGDAGDGGIVPPEGGANPGGNLPGDDEPPNGSTNGGDEGGSGGGEGCSCRAASSSSASGSPIALVIGLAASATVLRRKKRTFHSR